MKHLIFTVVLGLVLSGCKATPENVCEKYPGHYPDNYTFIPEEIKPIVRIEPRYPKKALDEKIEGYVKLSYSVINSYVTKVKIIESTNDVFNAEAIRALKKWRYQDTHKNCVQYPQEYKLTTQLDFYL